MYFRKATRTVNEQSAHLLGIAHFLHKLGSQHTDFEDLECTKPILKLGIQW